MKLLIFAVVTVAVVSGVRFQVKDDDTGRTCILLDITTRLTVSAKRDSAEYRKTFDVIEVPQDNVTGSCGDSNSDSNATMTVDFGSVGSWTLMFVKEEFVLLRQKFAFIPGAFVNETLPTDETVTLVQSDNMTLSSLNKSFLCDVQRTVQFGSLNSEDYSYSMMQDISSLHVQAFGIADDKYSPAEECALDTTTEATTEPSTTIQATSEPSSDAATTLEPITTEATTEPNTTPKPTTQPSTPTPFPTLPTPLNPNTYMVYGTNATCIVFKAIISFSGFTYTQSGGGTGETDDIFIPFFGVASGIAVNGSCGNDTSSIQTMSIEFNGNWTLFLMFERSDAADDRKHGAKDEFSLREIQLTYYLSSQFFNDALQQGKVQTASQTNMKDFMKGQLGGSYKCDAEMTRTLSNGVIFKTKDLQYKAFSTDAGTDFSTDQVSECAGDDVDDGLSHKLVYIAVGASLVGVVFIVSVALLIRRCRATRRDYEPLDSGSVCYKGL